MIILEIIMKQTHKQLLDKCREIVALIENSNELMQVLEHNIWNSVSTEYIFLLILLKNPIIIFWCWQINYYYYEVFLILIMLMEEKGAKPDVSSVFSSYRIIFLFLSSYQRIR